MTLKDFVHLSTGGICGKYLLKAEVVVLHLFSVLEKLVLEKLFMLLF